MTSLMNKIKNLFTFTHKRQLDKQVKDYVEYLDKLGVELEEYTKYRLSLYK